MTSQFIHDVTDDHPGSVRGAGEADGGVRGVWRLSHCGGRPIEGGRPFKREAARRLCEDQIYHRRNEGKNLNVFYLFKLIFVDNFLS